MKLTLHLYMYVLKLNFNFHTIRSGFPSDSPTPALPPKNNAAPPRRPPPPKRPPPPGGAGPSRPPPPGASNNDNSPEGFADFSAFDQVSCGIGWPFRNEIPQLGRVAFCLIIRVMALSPLLSLCKASKTSSRLSECE